MGRKGRWLVSLLVNRLINKAVCQLAKGTLCLVMLQVTSILMSAEPDCGSYNY